MILAIDQGPPGAPCLVFDRQGRIAGRAYSEFEQHFPRPGWVEHDASEIWEVARGVATAALGDAGIAGSELLGIGIANQRETVVAWDPDTGEPVHRALVWQDRRTAERCDELKRDGHEALVRERTGLVIDPYFSGTKLEWLLRNVDAARERAVLGTIDSWLAFKLTGRHLTDYSNASRTMLFDIRGLGWDRELCDLLGVDPSRLPEPVPSAQVYGHTDVFGGKVAVAGIAGDQQAALFGQACHRAGLEAIAYQTVDAVRAQEAAAGEALEVLKADGGAVANRWLMQFQADLLGVPVVVPEIAETTALGGAYLAGIATGAWDRAGVEAMWRGAVGYEPAMAEDERETPNGGRGGAPGRAKGGA